MCSKVATRLGPKKSNPLNNVPNSIGSPRRFFRSDIEKKVCRNHDGKDRNHVQQSCNEAGSKEVESLEQRSELNWLPETFLQIGYRRESMQESRRQGSEPCAAKLQRGWVQRSRIP